MRGRVDSFSGRQKIHDSIKIWSKNDMTSYEIWSQNRLYWINLGEKVPISQPILVTQLQATSSSPKYRTSCDISIILSFFQFILLICSIYLWCLWGLSSDWVRSSLVDLINQPRPWSFQHDMKSVIIKYDVAQNLMKICKGRLDIIIRLDNFY